MRGDFHIHTIYSDGVKTPKEIIDITKKHYDIIAITDHDTLDGVKTVLDNKDPKVILGVEVTTFENGENVHVLGYFNLKTQKQNDSFKELEHVLSKQREMRKFRCLEIARRLKTYFNIDLDTTALIKKTSITRGTIANQILAQGYNYDRQELFEKFIGEGCKAYVPASHLPISEAIRLLRNCDATIILAHPILLKKNDYKKILEYGFDGLEAIYPANTPKKEQEFIQYAKDNNLLVTAGTDYHSDNDGKHANLGDIYLEGELLEKFLAKVQ